MPFFLSLNSTVFLLLGAVLGLSLFLVGSTWNYIWWIWDDGNYLYPSVAWLQGFIPNFDFRSGYPGLSIWIQQLLFQMTEKHLSLYKIMGIVITLLTSWGMYKLTRLFASQTLGVFVAFLTLVNYVDIPAFNPGYAMQLCVLLSIYSLLKYSQQKQYSLLLVSAFLIGISIGFKQSGLFAILGWFQAFFILHFLGKFFWKWSSWLLLIAFPLLAFVLLKWHNLLFMLNTSLLLPWGLSVLYTAKLAIGRAETKMSLELSLSQLFGVGISLLLGCTLWLLIYPDPLNQSAFLLKEIYLVIPTLIDRELKPMTSDNLKHVSLILGGFLFIPLALKKVYSLLRENKKIIFFIISLPLLFVFWKAFSYLNDLERLYDAVSSRKNLLTNSDFNVWSNSTLENATSIINLDGTDASGWKTANDMTISVDTGKLKLLKGSATTTAIPWATRNMTLVKGKLYRLKGQAQAGTWHWGRIQIYDNTEGDYVHHKGMNLPTSMDDYDFAGSPTYGSVINSDGDLIFEAKNTGTYQLILVMTDATTALGGNGKNFFFNNISLYEVTRNQQYFLDRFLWISPLNWKLSSIAIITGIVLAFLFLLYEPPWISSKHQVLAVFGFCFLASGFPYGPNLTYCLISILSGVILILCWINQSQNFFCFPKNYSKWVLISLLLMSLWILGKKTKQFIQMPNIYYPNLNQKIRVAPYQQVFVEVAEWLKKEVSQENTIGGYPHFSLVFALINHVSFNRFPNFLGSKEEFESLVLKMKQGQTPDYYLIAPNLYPITWKQSFFFPTKPILEILKKQYELIQTFKNHNEVEVVFVFKKRN